FMIAHDLPAVRYMSHQMAVMYLGQIVESGPAEAVYSQPQHPYTQALLASVPIMGVKRERLYQIEGQPPDLRSIPSGCAFWPRCPSAMDICREQYPPQIPIGDGDYVHCWLAGK
ncbi:MAG: ABC transporter ATP-binding protein, partial [Dehalococcoidia bacterium]|nr:ABC transporter ATP-binding protein [Dehalococcoidia bacterium]